MRKELKKQKGAIALITIIIISAASLLMAYTASILGFRELDTGYVSSKGEEAFSLTDGCVEEALYRLVIDSSYSGGSLSLSNGSCIINVTANGNDRIVAVVGTVSGPIEDYVKRVEVDLTLSGYQVTINSWEEKQN